MTADTVGASGDLHLRLRYRAQPIPEAEDPVVPESGRTVEQAEAEQHGIARAEIVEGDVGVVDIRRFFPLSMSRTAVTRALHTVASAAALIVDLRRCLGGEPEMVAFVCSFLVDEPTQLSSLYFPDEDLTIEWWTDPVAPGPIFGGAKPLLVLVGGATISAGEGFAYDLQQLGRATVVGERTAGAANFDYRYRVSDHLMFSVPSGYPVNPISGTNWEGVGVAPDVAIDAGEALDTAKRLLQAG